LLAEQTGLEPATPGVSEKQPFALERARRFRVMSCTSMTPAMLLERRQPAAADNRAVLHSRRAPHLPREFALRWKAGAPNCV